MYNAIIRPIFWGGKLYNQNTIYSSTTLLYIYAYNLLHKMSVIINIVNSDIYVACNCEITSIEEIPSVIYTWIVMSNLGIDVGEA